MLFPTDESLKKSLYLAKDQVMKKWISSIANLFVSYGLIIKPNSTNTAVILVIFIALKFLSDSFLL